MGEEGARLGEGGAERARAGGDADEVEEVAVLAGGGVGPLAGDAGRREADEEGAPPGAADVAGGPVSAVLAAVGEIAPADLLGARAEGGGDGGGVHGAHPARMTAPAKPGRRMNSESMGAPRSRLPGERPVPAPLRLPPAPGRRAQREARAQPYGRCRFGSGVGGDAWAAMRRRDAQGAATTVTVRPPARER